MERLYQYLWQHGMLGRELALTDGTEVKVLSPGRLNRDAGPDFSSARVLIGDTEWVGNVEIHVRASDWFRHKHDEDPVYDSVILHVVSQNDRRVSRSDGSLIPQVAVNFPHGFYQLFLSLSEGTPGIRCHHNLLCLNKLTITDWLETLTVERMQDKAWRILQMHSASSGDWARTCFVTFARALGFGLNSDPFEIMARSITLNHLSRHSDNLFQLEALLFGQAGMLDMSNHIFDEYYQNLCREYYFLARKYGLRPMRSDLWKYARTRPGNFPHRRIALLARYLEGGFSLVGEIMACGNDTDRLKEIFRKNLEGYWANHIGFGAEMAPAPVALSEASIELLIINLVAPLIYAHCRSTGDYERAEDAFNIWRDLEPEKNAIIRSWNTSGIKAEDAAQSQALLWLRKNYCDRRKCLDCRFGHAMLRESMKH